MNTFTRLLFACAALAWTTCAGAHGTAPAPHAEKAAASANAKANTTARDLTMSLLDLKVQLDSAGPSAQGRLLPDLLSVARARHDELTALLDTDPAEVLRIALPADLRFGMPAQAVPFLEQDADETGELEVMHVDHVNPADDFYIHALKTSHGTFTLH